MKKASFKLNQSVYTVLSNGKKRQSFFCNSERISPEMFFMAHEIYLKHK